MTTDEQALTESGARRMRVPAGPRLASLALGLLLAGGAHAGSADTDTQVERLHRVAPALDPAVLELALTAQQKALREGLIDRSDVLSIIDYSLPFSCTACTPSV